MYWRTCSSSNPTRGHCVTTGPEVLTREITLPAAQAGHRDRALPLEKADHRGHRVLRGNSDAHMHMVRHQVPFDDLALFLTCQRMEDFSQLPTRLTKALCDVVWERTPHGICSPISNGIGFDKFQTLNILLSWFSPSRGEDAIPETVKPVRVSLVEPVAYLKPSYERRAIVRSVAPLVF